jgi:hypothetical protein
VGWQLKNQYSNAPRNIVGNIRAKTKTVPKHGIMLKIHYHFQMMLINRDYPKIAATSASEKISQAISDANNEALFASIVDSECYAEFSRNCFRKKA